jgi:hydroxymethylbilane synthase
MSGRTLNVGTRGSDLALWQTRHVMEALARLPGAPAVAIVKIETSGDLLQDQPVRSSPGRAFFTAEIDRALLAARIDIAVHSLKDLSTALPEGIALAAVLEREDPRDCLISRDGTLFTMLRAGAKVGTSSPRRWAFARRIRPDLLYTDLRGNVPTRLRKLAQGDYDAIILAVAGLKRLGLADRITEILSVDDFLPAVGQGAIGVCARADDRETLDLLARLDHAPTRAAVSAERALLAHLEGGCQVPVGALATVDGGQVALTAAVASLDGNDYVHGVGTGATGSALGVDVAQDLLARGAGDVLKGIRLRHGKRA